MESEFQDRTPELHQTCDSVVDSFSKHMDALSKRVDEGFDRILAELHQMLRDRGLPIPARRSSPRSQPENISHSSSSETIILFPNARIRNPIRSAASSSLAILESASTPLDSSPLVTETVEEKQATTLPAIGKDFESTEPDFQKAAISGESSTCQIVENLESTTLRGNLNTIETRNRVDELKIVEALAKSANRDEYQLENEDFENSVSGAHKVLDKMPEQFPSLELISKDTIFAPAGTELFKEVDLMNFIFDPGGESHMSKSTDRDKLVFNSEQYGECDGSFGGLMISRLKGNEMIAAASKFRIQQWDPVGKMEGTKRAAIDDPLVIAICYQGGKEECEFTAEFVGLLQCSPSKIVVFDPGGAGGSYLLFPCHIIQRKIWNWKSECMGIQEEFACWVKESELGADCRKFTLLQWDPGGFILVKLGQQPKFVSHEDPGGRLTAEVKFITLNLSAIESHVLVRCSTKPSTSQPICIPSSTHIPSSIASTSPYTSGSLFLFLNLLPSPMVHHTGLPRPIPRDNGDPIPHLFYFPPPNPIFNSLYWFS